MVSVPRSQLEPWVDDEGNVTSCEQACAAVGLDEPYDVLYCDSHIPGLGGSTGGEAGGGSMGDPSTSSGGASTSGSSSGEASTGDSSTGGSTGVDDGASTTGDGDDPTVVLNCHWELICGRGHAGLHSDGSNRAADVVGRWAAKAAHAEAASVPAFVHLGRELSAHGAPASLCRRARAAAADEVVHTVLMRAVARGRGATVPRPEVEALPIRTLEAIALENMVEGCVRETWAALEATWQAEHAGDAELRELLQRIAADEARHAELARDVDAWCRTRLDAAALARVDAARDQAVEQLRERVGTNLTALLVEATGLPTQPRARRLLDGMVAALWPATSATTRPQAAA